MQEGTLTHPARGTGSAIALAALAAAVLAACGGGGSSSGEPTEPAPNDARLDVARTGDVVAYFKAKIAQRVALDMGTNVTVPTVGAVATAGSVVAHTGTSQTDPGVEEANLLKSDGSLVYALHRGYGQGSDAQAPRLAALSRLADGSLRSLARVTLDPQYIPSGLYLANNATRVAVLSQQDPYYGRQTATGGSTQLVAEYSRRLSLDLFSSGGSATPAQLRQVRIDGLLVGSRQVGNMLYVVSTWSPDLSRFNMPLGSASSVIDSTLAPLNAAALMPTVQVDAGTAQPLVAETDCLLQSKNASLSLQITTVTAIDLSSDSLARTSRCFAGGSEGVFVGATNLYLASSRQYRYGTDVPNTVFPAGSRTDIHKFALKGTQVDYRASNSVEGHLGWDANRLGDRLNEYQGDLRVLTFTGNTGQSGQLPVTIQSLPAAPAQLNVLRENTSDRSLANVATLPNTQRTTPLAPAGKQVDTAHFAGSRIYLLSLDRSAPLKVVDASTATSPVVAGDLPGAGYADHLYPLANGLLLGIGKDTSAGGNADGIQVALFDTSNAAQTRRLAADTLGLRGSLTALDTRDGRLAMNIVQQGQRARIAFPARVYQTPDGSTSPPAQGQQGAVRFDVDTSARTLAAQPMLASTALYADNAAELQTRYNLANERILQLDTALYYVSGGLTYYMVGF